MDEFDIVIPVGPNDNVVVKKQIHYTKENIIGYRNIYLICYDPSLTIDGCITINEDIFPFSIHNVSNIHGKLERNGWYLQQLIKLYCGLIIPGIMDKYLVIDSDTFFLKPTHFVQDGKCLYNYGRECHIPYFIHMAKLCKDFRKMERDKSGICHHMIFETKYIKEIIDLIENNHSDKFYNVFLNLVTEKSGSGASEYEIYFNYVLKYHKNEIKLRKLTWINSGDFDRVISSQNYDYFSYHWYMRK
jgi:hypothetical protein